MMNQDENELDYMGMSIEDYVHRYKWKNTIKDKKTGKDVFRKPFLTHHQQEWLKENALQACMSTYTNKYLKFLNKNEDINDLRQEAYEAFHLCLCRYNPNKINYVYKKQSAKNKNNFNLGDPVYASKKFSKFIADFFKTQKPRTELKKIYKKDYDVYMAGALEWFKRQFLYMFGVCIEWKRVDNIDLTNKARDSHKVHQKDLSIGELHRTVVARAEDEVNDNDPEVYIKNLLKGLDDLMASYLLDRIEGKKSPERYAKDYPSDKLPFLDAKADELLNVLKADGLLPENKKLK